MRWKRAIVSVWVYENTWPTCSEPLTVGGGVSIAYTCSRLLVRSNVYVPAASQADAHFSSSPSRLGSSGTVMPLLATASPGRWDALVARRGTRLAATRSASSGV